jgi:uncharacterized protein (TIGR02118 family)
MIKRLTQWQPREGLTREAALRYWRDEHAPLLEAVPGVVKYVQNHCTVAPDGAEPPYAGLGEVWFESRQAAEDAATTNEWESVLEDAATFMDMTRVVAAWADEHVVL